MMGILMSSTSQLTVEPELRVLSRGSTTHLVIVIIILPIDQQPFLLLFPPHSPSLSGDGIVVIQVRDVGRAPGLRVVGRVVRVHRSRDGRVFAS
jgi:hypothetical protein